MACCLAPRLHRLSLTVIGVFLLLSVVPRAPAQTFDVTNLHQPADLDTKWLIHAGDDAAYARPDFDDTGWTLFDPHSSLANVFPQRPEVVWYRLRVKVNPAQTGLALNERNISRAFEIYVNGERLIASGEISPFVPYTLNARLLARIPDHIVSTSSVVIAMRVHLSPAEWGNGQNPGYYANNLAIGQEYTLYRENWLSVIGQESLHWINNLLLICLGLVALVFFAAQRRQTEYWWIFAVGALTLMQSLVPFISLFHNLPLSWEVASTIFRLVSPYIWVSFYFSFVREPIAWKWRSILIFAGITNVVGATAAKFLYLPQPILLMGNLPFIILLSVVVPIVLAIHWRRGNREAGILLVPVIFYSLYIYAEVAFAAMFQFPAGRTLALRGFGIIDQYPAGPFSLSLDYVAGILSTVSLAAIMLSRSNSMSRRRAQLESELAAAQQVQQLLVPEQAESVRGYTVESVYQPAQQVGGDFFQILPAGNGGLLIVIGDVAGKGLSAAMLVSVLVGAIRGVAEYTKDPSELLANLNERLVGRGGGGFSTALVARVAADGKVTICNAGHLSPYLDGVEVELPGALPLGVTSASTYETTEFYIEPGVVLLFIQMAWSRRKALRASYLGLSAPAHCRRSQLWQSSKQRSSLARKTTSPSSPLRATQPSPARHSL